MKKRISIVLLTALLLSFAVFFVASGAGATLTAYCEHCQTNRDRRNSYIVFNESTQEFKQVGKSCLRDYTNGLSAEMVALHESFLKCAEEAHEWYGTSGGWFDGWFKVDEFMSYAAETIRIYGYAKRDGYNISTASRVEDLYRKAKGMRLFVIRIC